jgi:hypothetical protein
MWRSVTSHFYVCATYPSTLWEVGAWLLFIPEKRVTLLTELVIVKICTVYRPLFICGLFNVAVSSSEYKAYKVYRPLFIICGLFNVAVSSSDYKASNGRAVSKLWIKNMEGSCRSLLELRKITKVPGRDIRSKLWNFKESDLNRLSSWSEIAYLPVSYLRPPVRLFRTHPAATYEEAVLLSMSSYCPQLTYMIWLALLHSFLSDVFSGPRNNPSLLKHFLNVCSLHKCTLELMLLE